MFLQTVDGPLIIPALGTGITVTVNVVAGPVQPLIVAFTLTVAITGLMLLLVAVKAGITPTPLKPKPTSMVLVQL